MKERDTHQVATYTRTTTAQVRFGRHLAATGQSAPTTQRGKLRRDQRGSPSAIRQTPHTPAAACRSSSTKISDKKSIVEPTGSVNTFTFILNPATYLCRDTKLRLRITSTGDPLITFMTHGNAVLQADVIDWVAPHCQSTQNAHGGNCVASDQRWFIQ